jgi:hypothetical protein
MAPPEKAVPFEQTADFKKIQAQNAAAIQLERQRAASAERLERLRQSGNRSPDDRRDPPVPAAELKARRDAKQKLVTVDAAMRRVERLAAASQNLGNAVADGGPVDGFLLSRTPSGQELVQSAASLMPALTALTRVPGIGAQSDLEQRLAQLQLPDPSMYPDVRARAVEELKLFMADLRNAYLNAAGMEGGTSAAPSQAAPAQSGGWSIQEIR